MLICTSRGFSGGILVRVMVQRLDDGSAQLNASIAYVIDKLYNLIVWKVLRGVERRWNRTRGVEIFQAVLLLG